MLRLRLKLYTYHTFLVIPFLVLFLYAHNLEFSKPEMTYRTLLWGTFLCCICYGFAQLFFRDRLKTGVYVTLLLFGLFQYGVLYELLDMLAAKGLWPFEHVHRFLLSLYLLLFAGLLFFFKRTVHDFIRVNYFLNFLLILLLLFNLGKVLMHKTFAKASGKEIKLGTDQEKFGNSSYRPDIYYIILDGYASRNTLKKYYKTDNPFFYEGLKGLGFRFCDSAFSNYYSTTRSLCATLNMRYVHEMENALEGLRNNKTFSVLKHNGYSIYNLRSGFEVTRYFAQADSAVGIGGPNEFELSLLKHTVLRLDDAFGFFAVRRLQSQFEKMYRMADLVARPKFCFMHFVAPHPPFVFEADGRTKRTHLSDENLWEPEDAYIAQLSYVSKQIVAFVRYLLQKNPDAVVLIQSDHGPYGPGKNMEEVFETRSGILYAYRAPDKLVIPQRTSSINTFPRLFTALFDLQMELPQDSTAGKALFLSTPVLRKKLEE